MTESECPSGLIGGIGWLGWIGTRDQRTHSMAGALDYSSRADGRTSNLLKMQFVLLQSTIFDDDDGPKEQDDEEQWVRTSCR